MSSTNQSKKPPVRKRTYLQADDDLIERAKKAMQELKIDSKIELSAIADLSPSTINRFFQKQAIQPDSYNQICETLFKEPEETVAFTINGRIDKKFIEELNKIVEVLQQLSVSDSLIFIKK